MAAATAGDPDLEKLVLDILRSATLEGTFLDSVVPGEQARQVAEALIDSAPRGREADRESDRAAGYELSEPLGSGGFGTVWLARRLEPVRREVALEVLELVWVPEALAYRFRKF